MSKPEQYFVDNWEIIKCYNPYEGDFGGDETQLEDKLIVTRKEHKCIICFETIKKGDTARLLKSVCDGEFFIHRICPECMRAVVIDENNVSCRKTNT